MTGITLIILIVNGFLFFNINSMVEQIDSIYDSNIRLNSLTEALDSVQNSMTEYLNTKSTESMESYYRCEQELKDLIASFNVRPTSDRLLLAEKNIANLTSTYLNYTDGAIEAKRGRNVEKYSTYYDNAVQVHSFVSEYIFSLNNEKFKENADSYAILSNSFKTIEAMCTVIYIIVAIVGLILVSILSSAITNPLRELVDAAKKVSAGDYDVEFSGSVSKDEIGVVKSAFTSMVDSIQDNIITLRSNMEREQQMKENELMMEAHLKDARLKYLQAQINPHFLFNTLNAGAQLAMMEGADKAYEYIQQVASFFRYNIKKDNEEVSLRDEVSLVDTYIYILNVRFSGEIGYEKDIDESLLDIRLPGMCLQPIVENAVNYGIRDIQGGVIKLSVYREGNDACISIKDNGAGMTAERIDQVRRRHVVNEGSGTDSNGIGLNNVMTRIELMYGDTDMVDIISNGPGTGTEIRMYIPYTENE